MRSFKLPEAAYSATGNGRFIPNVGLETNVVRRKLVKSQILDEANSFISQYGYEAIRKRDLGPKTHNGIAAEVGDDQLSIEQSVAKVAFEAVLHTRMGMKRSEEDTSVNCHYGNYAEDLVVLPSGYGQTYLNARNSSGINAMSYMDVPKLRLAIDIRPMRMDHSSTNDGKASMVGARQRWIPLESPLRGIYECFSLFQDVNLGLIGDKKFQFFPSSLGGYGKEPPFRNYRNFERFLHHFRGGSHSELIREILQRTVDYLFKKERGEDPAKDPLLSHIVRFQSSFHDWVKGRSIYAPVTWADVPPEVAQFRLARTGQDPVLDEVITRLVGEREVITEQQLEIAVEHNELCKALLKAENILKFKEIRDKARREWSSYSTFSMENYGMIKELGLEKPNRLRKLRPVDVQVFYNLLWEKRYNLRQILREEYIYDRKAMDEIYRRGPMSVDFNIYPKVGIGVRGFAAQSIEYRLDVEDTEHGSAVHDLLLWLQQDKGRMATPVPTLAINDDNELIRRCKSSMYNVIITDDRKLCRKATQVTGSVIFQVPCIWYYKCIYFGARDWSEILEDFVPGLKWTVHEDTGSIKSFEERQFRDGVMLSRPATCKFNIYKNPRDWKDPEILEEFLDYGDEPPVDIRSLFHDVSNALKMRGNYRRQYGRGQWR